MANQEAIREWYVALKGGTYPQGEGTLRSTTGYCCWGVACDLFREHQHMPAHWTERRPLTTVFGFKIEDGSSYTGLPPTEVAEGWLGIRSVGLVNIPAEIRERHDGIGGYGYNLATLNDKGLTFDEIADIIWFNYGEGDPPDVG